MKQPFSFFGLIIASFYGYLFFDEKPDLFTWFGAFVIFIEITIITIRETKLNKNFVRKKITTID